MRFLLACARSPVDIVWRGESTVRASRPSYRSNDLLIAAHSLNHRRGTFRDTSTTITGSLVSLPLRIGIRDPAGKRLSSEFSFLLAIPIQGSQAADLAKMVDEPSLATTS